MGVGPGGSRGPTEQDFADMLERKTSRTEFDGELARVFSTHAMKSEEPESLSLADFHGELTRAPSSQTERSADRKPQQTRCLGLAIRGRLSPGRGRVCSSFPQTLTRLRNCVNVITLRCCL